MQFLRAFSPSPCPLVFVAGPMFLSRKLRTLPFLVLGFVLSFSTICSAQWVTESYPLKPGWNAIWLSHDCSSLSDDTTRSIGDVLAQTPQIEEVWRWNPLGSSVQFTQSPGKPIAKDASWAVWRRGDQTNTTLGTLTGNSAYLLKVASTAPSFTLQLTGKPLVPNYSFSSSGLNFLGFPVADSPPKFDTFFSNSEELKTSPEIFRYVGGPLSEVFPKNPQLIVATRSAPVIRGRAYWVKGSSYSEFYGPLKVSVIGTGGVDFGRKLNSVTLRIKNVTDPAKGKTVTADFSLASSEAAPGEFEVPPGVDLYVRGDFGPNLQFASQSLAESSVTLAPGEETDLVLMANRVAMNVADQNYASILRITDSLNHTRIDLPVSATGSSRNGVWIGAAVLDSVNRVETISGPSFNAVGTPNGAGPETRSVTTVTRTTAAGVTTETTSDMVDFDADGNAALTSAGIDPAEVTVTSINDADPLVPDFLQGVDYTVGPSSFALITNSGSGYTEAPEVVFSEGDASAIATLSARVNRVVMKDGGSGYRNQATALTISGGDGFGAEGVITIANGQIVSVTMSKGGSDYTEAPIIEFPRPANGGATATGDAVIENGEVTAVTITNPGSGYGEPIEVIFTGESTSEASGFAVVSDSGIITDVFITNGGMGYRESPSIDFQGGGGGGAAAEAEITGGVAKVEIDNPGANYAGAPTLSFKPVNDEDGGSGAAATVFVGEDGLVTGFDRVQKVDNESGSIGDRALVTLSSRSPAEPGTPDGTTQSTVVSISQVVTDNGESRLVTRRISSGSDAAAPSNFPVRLILHAPKSGAPKLLQRVFLGEREGASYAGTSETALAGIVTGPGDSTPGKLGRSSTASFPLGGSWTADSGVWGESASFTVLLGYNASTNPFVHSYHPDHDNWDARFEEQLENKEESYTVERKITFDFSPTPPAGLNEPGWGVTTLGGTYTETFSGLRSQEVSVSGNFILYQVSEAPALIDNP
jgi:hypothetical protein